MKKAIQVLSLFVLVFALGGCNISKQLSSPNSPDVNAQNQQLVKSNNFDQKSRCATLGEEYYSNYLKEQEHNPLFSFDVYDLSHEIGYSTESNTCLIYVMMKYKDIGEKIGGVRNQYIWDLLNNKTIYSMAYSGSSDNNVVLKMASDFQTPEEFMNKKIELFK